MKRFILPLAALAFGSSVALAQAETKSHKTDSNPAISTTKENNPGAPASGANSFTEAQARERIAERGFTDISALVKDEQGVWRGKATLAGATHDVAVDYQGNVTHQ